LISDNDFSKCAELAIKHANGYGGLTIDKRKALELGSKHNDVKSILDLTYLIQTGFNDQDNTILIQPNPKKALKFITPYKKLDDKKIDDAIIELTNSLKL
jgi:hypothetical protein